MKQIQTLCMIKNGDQLLLGMKKRGFGAGRWNGFGGKVEKGESVEAAARRELREEISIIAGEMLPRGVMNFSWQDQLREIQMHVFEVTDFSGEPAESEEMRPRWFSVQDIPYDDMWTDDRFWLPLFLAGKNFKGDILFDSNDKIIRHTIHETADI